ncbi:unnamed protein product [Prorocentrum cordatum]|uniref:Uncharacterized protein n=1 Tax=Prorocentrum cordatum TaxID=2364126 RepID=A0ABN9TW39_9DINO|nr:unnamed protein product [Polarella glacialis]
MMASVTSGSATSAGQLRAGFLLILRPPCCRLYSVLKYVPESVPRCAHSSTSPSTTEATTTRREQTEYWSQWSRTRRSRRARTSPIQTRPPPPAPVRPSSVWGTGACPTGAATGVWTLHGHGNM